MKAKGFFSFIGSIFPLSLRNEIQKLKVNMLSRKVVLLEKELEIRIPPLQMKIDADIRHGSKFDFIPFIEKKGDFYFEMVMQRLRNGEIPMVAEVEGKKIVGYLWINLNEMRVPELGQRMKLESKEAYLYDAYVLPEYRNKGIIRSLMRQAFLFLRSIQTERGYAYTLSLNKPLRKVARMTDHKEVGMPPYQFKYKFIWIKNYSVTKLRMALGLKAGNLPLEDLAKVFE